MAFTINEYGNSYKLPSPEAKKLMSLLRDTCKAHGMICDPDECFRYIAELPEKYQQLSLFDQ